MATEDYFSIVTGLGVREAERSTVFPYPPQQCREISPGSSNNSYNSFSSASCDGFITRRVTDLKASTLCANQGTVADFQLLGDEYCYLGVDQPMSEEIHYSFLRQHIEKQRRQKKPKTKGEVRSKQISFEKREMARKNTSSLLTKSLSMQSHRGCRWAGLRCEDLPSAFDEDEERMIDEVLDRLG